MIHYVIIRGSAIDIKFNYYLGDSIAMVFYLWPKFHRGFLTSDSLDPYAQAILKFCPPYSLDYRAQTQFVFPNSLLLAKVS